MKARVFESPSPVDRAARAGPARAEPASADAVRFSVMGSKSRSRARAGMPGPKSRTRMHTAMWPSSRGRSSSRSQRTKICRPMPCEYLRAFETRFPRAFARSSASVQTTSERGSSGAHCRSSSILKYRALDEKS
eukprot:Amastigsp_a842552_9.p5 type:complete len:134 gc:universal Amastigsp_a842552_9:629-1030(+)